MDDRRISHGLALLADEADPPAVDVPAVIAAAKARTRSRRLVAATAVGTAAVVGALAAGVGFVGQEPADTPAARQTTTTEPPATHAEPFFDERARRFTEQVSQVLGFVLRPRVEFSGPNHGQHGLGIPVFQGFERDGRSDYHGAVDLITADATAELEIWVVKEEPGLPIDQPSGTPNGPCSMDQNCWADELPDGTVVRTLMEADSQVVFAKRPDGTVVEVSLEATPAGTDLSSLVERANIVRIVEALTY